MASAKNYILQAELVGLEKYSYNSGSDYADVVYTLAIKDNVFGHYLTSGFEFSLISITSTSKDGEPQVFNASDYGNASGMVLPGPDISFGIPIINTGISVKTDGTVTVSAHPNSALDRLVDVSIQLVAILKNGEFFEFQIRDTMAVGTVLGGIEAGNGGGGTAILD